ncbi:MAG: BatA domain-containing protein, partial [Planctomycetes bacterium]|nr:BatA domain-containing protein [Planctomycetota bacterium]
MGFLNPWLLAGILGIAVPILIHLLDRFRYRRTEWAAMELLRRALRTRSRRIRIEDLLILVLRSLAVALAAIALARPTLSARGAKWLGGESRVGAVIAIDGSFSMAARPGVRSRFERAREIVRAIEGELRQGDSLDIVLLGRAARILCRGATYGEARVQEAIRAAAPLDERLDLDASLDDLAERVAEMKTPVRECYLVTDAQRISWAQPSARARRSIERIAERATVFILPTPSDGAENIAIEEFSLASGALRRGATARFVARVRNHGGTPREGVALRLLAGGEPVDRRAVDRIAPGEAVEISLYARFDEAGIARLTAKLDPDALPADDERRAVVEIPDRIRVLCVDGDPSGRSERCET